MKRIEDYRNKHTRVINELVFLKDNFIIDVIENGDNYQFEDSIIEAIQMPTQYHL
jgi:hypothetical protein